MDFKSRETLTSDLDSSRGPIEKWQPASAKGFT